MNSGLLKQPDPPDNLRKSRIVANWIEGRINLKVEEPRCFLVGCEVKPMEHFIRVPQLDVQ